MKARKKGSNDEWKDVINVQLRDSYWTSADQIEFQHENLFTELKTYGQVDEEKHWQDVRERAAIAAMQGMLSCGEGAFSYGGIADKIAKSAVEQADALVKQLKGE